MLGIFEVATVKWLLASIFLSLMSPGAAYGQTDTFVDQYARVKKTFFGDADDVESYSYKVRENIFQDIEGEWGRVPLIPNDPGVNKFITNKLCAVIGVRIQVKNEYTLLFAHDKGKDTEDSTTYTSMQGNVFAVAIDPVARMHRVGADIRYGKDSRDAFLLGKSGIAMIFRPEKDILILQMNYGEPQIWGRCSQTR